ncbi:MAG: hypothetical protein PUF72_05485 [Clostridiales bacterium]|nr:hypothetical protein [Clostridiales bacterium]
MKRCFVKNDAEMNDMIERIGERLVAKMRIVNNKRIMDSFENKRYCPAYSEFNGMLQILKTMNIDYDIDYDDEVTEMTAITIMGHRFKV